MNHQATSFWNGHKVTSHSEVCHRYRPTFSDLTFKNRNHTTTTTQYITKTNRTISRLATLIKSSDNQLSHTFSCSHYVWWINGLICRNHDHFWNSSSINRLSNIISPKDIILKGFFWIALHHRNMFMGCSMVNNRWFVLFKNLKQTIVILNISNDRNKINSLEFTNQFMVNQINRVFSMTEQNDTFRIEATDLTANF